MDERQLARFRRLVFLYMALLMTGGMATSVALYVVLPRTVIFIIAGCVALVCAIWGIWVVRKMKAMVASKRSPPEFH